MESTTQAKLALFAANAQIMRKAFPWHNTLTKRLAALLYAQEGKGVDCDAVTQSLDLIKASTGMFSMFRGNMALCVAALLSLSPNPKERFDQTLRVYELLKEENFMASDYLAMAAYQIAAQADAVDYVSVVNRARAFYDGMKARHFFHTGQDDYIFAAMLGLSDVDVTAGTERIEQLYSRLKGEFWNANSVQALAQVLVLGHSDHEAAKRVLALRDAASRQGIKLNKAFTLPALGILALLPVEGEAIAETLAEAQAYLRAQKGFGVWSVQTQEIHLHAAAIVAGEYAQNVRDGVLTAALSTSITNLIIAQEAAMVAAISAGAAASAASSSS